MHGEFNIEANLQSAIGPLVKLPYQVTALLSEVVTSRLLIG